MLRRLALIFPPLLLAFGILTISVFRTASIQYEFSDENITGDEGKVLGGEFPRIDYSLAFPGKVLPGDPLWVVKATRDRFWLTTTTSRTRKSELLLLFADKRLASSRILFERGLPEEGFSTLEKAERYLAEASKIEKQNREKGLDTHNFLRILAYSSLKHFEVIEEILAMAPEDARPIIIELETYPKDVYRQARDALIKEEYPVPSNPFNWN